MRFSNRKGGSAVDSSEVGEGGRSARDAQIEKFLMDTQVGIDCVFLDSDAQVLTSINFKSFQSE